MYNSQLFQNYGSSYSSYPSDNNGNPNNKISYGVSNHGIRDDRLIGGGFVFPFLLGGVTGAAIAPAFWRPPYNRPYYGPGFYGPGFYGPYRPF